MNKTRHAITVYQEKRKGAKPIPENLDELLSESQKLTLPGLKLTGWELQFVRRPLFDEPVVILHNHIEDTVAVLDTFGSIKKPGGIKLRPGRHRTVEHAPAKPLLYL